MTEFLIDASVALAWCLPREPFKADADSIILAVQQNSGVVPRIFWSEVRSVLLRAEREGRVTAGSTEFFMAKLRDLPLVTDDECDEKVLLSLSRHYGLTGYDAEYLEAAKRRGSQLMTFDQLLKSSGRKENVVGSLKK